ncbi:DAK2 domain-containing protein [Candidatus Neomarinimicrobiota bacterium]
MSIVKITYIDGIRLHRGLIAGIRQVLSRQDYLNKINVFPVPDGDTGTNMAFTLQTIIDETNQQTTSHVGHAALSIADAALNGARGNSGVILAQFFQGFSDACADIQRLNVSHFAEAVHKGYEYSYDALSDPKEGTILSVIGAAAKTARDRAKHDLEDFHEAITLTLASAETALQKTPEQLPILKKNGVVDAGGQGFVYILKGVLEFITDGSIRAFEDENEMQPMVMSGIASASTPSDTKYQYCTECMVYGENIPRKLIKEELMEFGDSIVIGGSKDRVKVHIHSNSPEQVFAYLETHGALTGQKTDDMLKQIKATKERTARVAVVTDSTADIPPELVEELDIHVVAVKLSFGNIRHLDKVTITPDEFYTELRTNPEHPLTSQPTPGDFWRTFQFLSSHYESIVAIHLPAKSSGTMQSAQIAAKRLPDTSITVLDGLNTSVGLGMVAVAAARLAKEGANHDAVVEAARIAIENTPIYAAIQDLSYTVKGGRVSASKKRIADFLRATPVLGISEEDKIDMVGTFFGKKDIAKGLAKFTRKRIDMDRSYDVYVGHAQAPEAARRLAEYLPSMGYKLGEIHITEMSSALGVHAGPGAVILALQPIGSA